MAINDSGTQQSSEVLPVIGRKYSAEILEATAEPRSAQELSDELDIPIATCYRRIEELTEEGLLEAAETRSAEENKDVTVYKRSINTIHVDFSGSLSISTGSDAQSPTRKIDKIWRTIRTLSGTLN